MQQLTIKKNKEVSLQRQHPWIFSGALYTIPTDLPSGAMVEVVDYNGNILATGIYQPNSIAVRILHFGKVTNWDTFWLDKIEKAYLLRRNIGLINNTSTTAYRLIHGEGDGLSSLIIDVYTNVDNITYFVIQCHTSGLQAFLPKIQEALHQLYHSHTTIGGVFDKSGDILEGIENRYLVGETPAKLPFIINENNHLFSIDWEKGQKTGFFLDQRNNRQRLHEYVQNYLGTNNEVCNVLNLFSYTAGFSVYGLCAGATKVVSVDASKTAISLGNDNVQLNTNINSELHTSEVADVLHYLKTIPNEYDIIIVDPPAFAKHLSAKHKAIQAYKRINGMAIQQVKKGGFIFTFSCSQVITSDLFKGAVTAAAIEVGRDVRIIEHLCQPADHPINIYHPEGNYLKGLILQVV